MTSPILCRLIYASIADSGYGWETIKSILESSERNNERDQLTGVLLFSDGMFLQILEGERLAVTRTFERILSDARHHSVTLIQFCEITKRDFASWRMRQLELDDEVLNAVVGAAEFDPRSFHENECLDLMRGLAATSYKADADLGDVHY